MNGKTRWLTVAAMFGIIALMAALTSPLAVDASNQTLSTPQKDANIVVLKAEPATKVDVLNLKDELKNSMTSLERWLIGIILGVQGAAAAIVIGFMLYISRRLGALEQALKGHPPASSQAGGRARSIDQAVYQQIDGFDLTKQDLEANHE